jgi:hypothetical protein
VWGDSKDTEPIRVLHTFGRYAKIQITKNLARALRIVKGHYMELDEAHKNFDPDGDLKEQERKAGQRFRIWADALCINQKNDQERGKQVALMKYIYTQAEIVFGSLSPCKEFTDYKIHLALQGIKTFGPELAEDYAAIDSTNRPRHLGEFGWLERFLEKTNLTEDDIKSLWDSFSRFPETDYFRRVWITQEICLANSLYFMHEEQSVPWRVFAGVYIWLDLASGYLKDRDRTNPSRERYLMERFGGTAKNIIADLTFKGTSHLEYLRDWNYRLTQGIGFTARVRCVVGTTARNLAATVPKDYVYGLLGLTGYDIVPDYSDITPLGQVNAQFLSCWIADCESEVPDLAGLKLAPLGYAGLHFNSADIEQNPTWAPMFHELDGKYIFPPSSQHKVSISSIFDEAENPSVCIQQLELSVGGAEVDEVYTVFPESLAKMAESRTLTSTYTFYQRQVIQNHSTQGQSRSPLLPMKTMFQISLGRIVEDQSPNFLGLSIVWLIQFGLLVSAQGIWFLNTEASEWEPLDYDSAPESLLGRYLELFGSHIHDADRLRQTLDITLNDWDDLQFADVQLAFKKHAESRRLFLTKKGILGDGSVCTRPGDKLVIIKNGLQPAILRRVGAKNKGKWQLVGGCFVPQFEAGEIGVEDIGAVRRFVLV